MPTVVGVPFEASSVTVIGPSDAFFAALPDTAPVVNTSLVGATVMVSVWEPGFSGEEAAVRVGVPTVGSP